MSLSPMSHVEFKKCRLVDFRGEGPLSRPNAGQPEASIAASRVASSRQITNETTASLGDRFVPPAPHLSPCPPFASMPPQFPSPSHGSVSAGSQLWTRGRYSSNAPLLPVFHDLWLVVVESGPAWTRPTLFLYLMSTMAAKQGLH